MLIDLLAVGICDQECVRYLQYMPGRLEAQNNYGSRSAKLTCGGRDLAVKSTVSAVSSVYKLFSLFEKVEEKNIENLQHSPRGDSNSVLGVGTEQILNAKLKASLSTSLPAVQSLAGRYQYADIKSNVAIGTELCAK